MGVLQRWWAGREGKAAGIMRWGEGEGGLSYLR